MASKCGEAIGRLTSDGGGVHDLHIEVVAGEVSTGKLNYKPSTFDSGRQNRLVFFLRGNVRRGWQSGLGCGRSAALPGCHLYQHSIGFLKWKELTNAPRRVTSLAYLSPQRPMTRVCRRRPLGAMEEIRTTPEALVSATVSPCSHRPLLDSARFRNCVREERPPGSPPPSQPAARE
jgi:hypothetical protein